MTKNLNAIGLNLGCGPHAIPNYLNVDIIPGDHVDAVVDLERIPWPWFRGQWVHVKAFDILEHLGKITKKEAVRELARITARGGIVEIRVPCSTHRWALAALEHAHSFYFTSFDPWYDQPWFTVEEIRVGYGYMVPGKFIWVPYVWFTRPIIKFLTIFGIGQSIYFKLRRIEL